MKKICPFMSNQSCIETTSGHQDLFNRVYCLKEECMAWCKEIRTGVRIYGGYCKLIEKE